jgi:hypothetical protein
MRFFVEIFGGLAVAAVIGIGTYHLLNVIELGLKRPQSKSKKGKKNDQTDR